MWAKPLQTQSEHRMLFPFLYYFVSKTKNKVDEQEYRFTYKCL